MLVIDYLCGHFARFLARLHFFLVRNFLPERIHPTNTDAIKKVFAGKIDAAVNAESIDSDIANGGLGVQNCAPRTEIWREGGVEVVVIVIFLRDGGKGNKYN